MKQWNKMLKNHERAIPCLLIDLEQLDKNIETLQGSIKKEVDFRIVVKSLPARQLVQYVMRKANTEKLMVFHQPFLTDIASWSDETVDILLGKPMPIKTATYFYKNLPSNDLGFNPFQQIQWLVDTPTRIQEYIDLAKTLGQHLRLNIELDVGLHRGGFGTTTALKTALNLIQNNAEYVSFSGLMGYDPHVVKLPKILRSPQKALQLANDFYHECKALIQQDFPSLWQDNLTFNGAGSPTLELHHTENSPLNDISAGSCLVKPITFDIATLTSYKAACFIATPVLKQFEGTTIPVLEKAKSILNIINSVNQRSYFIYGGFWKADYCYPKGVQPNELFGVSTNQTMLNAPIAANLQVDDFVFLRPHQSEFVFLQFGKILAVRNNQIVEKWNLLKQY